MKTRMTASLGICFALGASVALAQEPAPPPQVETRGIVVSAAETVDDSGNSNLQIMSFSGDGNGAFFMASEPMAFEGGHDFVAPLGMGGMDSFDMLNNEAIQKELDFVGDQRDEYTRLQKDYQARMKEKIDALSKGGFSPDKAKDIGEEIKAIKEQQAQDIEQMLLPHQISRLKQIQLQQKMKTFGTVTALSDKKLLEELGISEEQMAKLKERAKELSTELQEKIKELREDTQKTLLQELSPEQREKLSSLTGDKFEIPAPAAMPERIRQRMDRRERTKKDD